MLLLLLLPLLLTPSCYLLLNHRKPIPRIVQDFDAHKVRKLFAKYSVSGVLSDKGLFVFGDNSYGAMGVGQAVDILPEVRMPTMIPSFRGITITDFELGQEHGVALSSDGEVYTWGRGDCGRLGTSVDETEMQPIVSVSACRETNFCRMSFPGTQPTLSLLPVAHLIHRGRCFHRQPVRGRTCLRRWTCRCARRRHFFVCYLPFLHVASPRGLLVAQRNKCPRF